MTVMQEGAAGQELAFERPVERSLVHRRAVTEVYVTDTRPVSGIRFAVAAQLPRSHRYFTDHTGYAAPDRLDRGGRTAPAGATGAAGPAETTGPDGDGGGRPAAARTTATAGGSAAPADGFAADPLLLTECCRQAATTVAHRYLGVPPDTAFLVTRWTARFTAAAPQPPGGGPDELTLLVGATDLRERGGRLESATLDVDLALNGTPAGHATIGAAYMPSGRYAALRALRRTTPPPLTSALPPRAGGTVAAPGAVGRSLPENVVLTDATPTPDGATARLDVPAGHPAIYDHPLDHVPAMGLIEAARQAALYTASRGERALLPQVAGFDAEFGRFAELDAPTTVTARRRGPVAGPPAGHTVAVDFRQLDTVICAITVTLADTGHRPGTRDGAEARRGARR
ncbi:AfsA-related hotdog domain-containing protein [Streptomyces sp. NPDC050560]|uniref:AfsA-related hotdog domain-containing protein n=1 Tax=Streptomyces sp. NPDC050560 TaxID=3365630 RepID=UPI0037BC8AC5